MKYLNIQTGMEAEILEATDTSVTFRTLPVGRPATTDKEKFDRVFRPVETEPKPSPIPEVEEPILLTVIPDKIKEKSPARPRKKKKRPTGRPRNRKGSLSPSIRKRREQARQRQKYRRRAELLRAKSRARYHARKAAGTLVKPTKKVRTPEQEAAYREQRKVYDRKYALKRKTIRRKKEVATEPMAVKDTDLANA